MAKADYFTVLESFMVNLDGENVLYTQGEVVAATDPALRKSPHLFVPLVVREHKAEKAEKPVEQATAAPGEKRAISTAGLRGR